MSLSMNITATEHGVVRLFAVETAQKFGHAQLLKALGVDALDLKHVDHITISDLDELGLEGYLTLGMGIPAEEVVAMRAQISALKGDVILIRSAAFEGKATRLSPQAPLRWIASFGETPLDTASTPSDTDSAKSTHEAAPQKRSNTTVLLWVLAAFLLMLLVTLSMFVRIAL